MAAAVPDPSSPGGQPRTLSTRAFLLWVVGLTVLVLLPSLVAGSEVRLIGLLIFLPAIGAGVGTVRQTVAASVWATAGALVSLGRDPQHDIEGILLVLLTVVFGVLAVYGCRWRLMHERELIRLRSTAAVIQQHILHPLPELTSRIVVDGVYEPVHEDKLFGGDIYDAADTAYGTRVLIGDVQGKGLSAVGIAIAVLGAFREAAHRQPTLSGLADALETSVLRYNAYARHSGEPERFVTALIICVDDEGDDRAQAVNCGHLLPWRVGAPDGPQKVYLGDAHVPLGLASLVEEERAAFWFDFPEEATLLLYTDGLSEARGTDGVFYPLAERLAALTSEACPSPGRLARELRDDVRTYTHAEPQDDIAILTLRRVPPEEAAAPAPAPGDVLPEGLPHLVDGAEETGGADGTQETTDMRETQETREARGPEKGGDEGSDAGGGGTGREGR